MGKSMRTFYKIKASMATHRTTLFLQDITTVSVKSYRKGAYNTPIYYIVPSRKCIFVNKSKQKYLINRFKYV